MPTDPDAKPVAGHHAAIRTTLDPPFQFFLGCHCGQASTERFATRDAALADPWGDTHELVQARQQ